MGTGRAVRPRASGALKGTGATRAGLPLLCMRPCDFDATTLATFVGEVDGLAAVHLPPALSAFATTIIAAAANSPVERGVKPLFSKKPT